MRLLCLLGLGAFVREFRVGPDIFVKGIKRTAGSHPYKKHIRTDTRAFREIASYNSAASFMSPLDIKLIFEFKFPEIFSTMNSITSLNLTFSGRYFSSHSLNTFKSIFDYYNANNKIADGDCFPS